MTTPAGKSSPLSWLLSGGIIEFEFIQNCLPQNQAQLITMICNFGQWTINFDCLGDFSKYFFEDI